MGTPGPALALLTQHASRITGWTTCRFERGTPLMAARLPLAAAAGSGFHLPPAAPSICCKQQKQLRGWPAQRRRQ